MTPFEPNGARPMPVPLWEGVGAVFFDLFDTLIEVDPDRLPRARWLGGEHPSTAPLLYQEIVRHAPGVSQDRLVETLIELWQEHAARKEKEWIEISALVRFDRLSERLGVAPGGDERESLARRLTEIHMRAISQATRAVEGAREILERVHQRGLRTALISNFDYAAAAPWILDRTGLAPLIETCVISESLGVRKPHQRMFEEALARLGVTPGQAVHVGDAAEADIWGAGRLGLRTVWINRRGGPFPRDEYPPDLTLAHLADLRDHLP